MVLPASRQAGTKWSFHMGLSANGGHKMATKWPFTLW
jgi:hypothetical protein